MTDTCKLRCLRSWDKPPPSLGRKDCKASFDSETDNHPSPFLTFDQLVSSTWDQTGRIWLFFLGATPMADQHVEQYCHILYFKQIHPSTPNWPNICRKYCRKNEAGSTGALRNPWAQWPWFSQNLFRLFVLQASTEQQRSISIRSIYLNESTR